MKRKEFSNTVKQLAEERQRGFCAICHVYLSNDDVSKVEYHHILGNQDNSLTNCVALCFNCHREDAHFEGNTKGYVLSEMDLDLYGKNGNYESYQETLKLIEEMNSKNPNALNESLDDLIEKKPYSTGAGGQSQNNPYTHTIGNIQKNLANTLSSVGGIMGVVGSSNTKKGNAEIDAIMNMHRKEGIFRDDLSGHLAKLILEYRRYWEEGIWFDRNHYTFGKDYLIPIMSDLKRLLNTRYSEYEILMLNYIKQVGIVDGSYRESYRNGDINIPIGLLSVIPKKGSIGFTGDNELEEFGYQLYKVVEKSIEEANKLIQYHKQLAENDEWNDQQHANHAEFLKELISSLQKALERVKDAYKILRGWLVEYKQAHLLANSLPSSKS